MTRNTAIMEQFMKAKSDLVKAYDELSDAIFRHCWFRIGDRERAKDLMQDTFTKTWQYINQGTQVNNLKPFLYKVANNLIIDEYRKRKELSLDGLMAEGFEPGFDDIKNTETAIDAKLVLGIINQLDEKHRGVVLMRYIDELSPKEIAEIIGDNENNISVRIHRGLKQLKDILNKNNG